MEIKTLDKIVLMSTVGVIAWFLLMVNYDGKNTSIIYWSFFSSFGPTLAYCLYVYFQNRKGNRIHYKSHKFICEMKATGHRFLAYKESRGYRYAMYNGEDEPDKFARASSTEFHEMFRVIERPTPSVSIERMKRMGLIDEDDDTNLV